MSDISIFKDKILSIRISSDDCSHDLISPHFEEIKGRTFLVGEVAEQSTESGWIAGKKSGIAWDEIYEYFIFDTLEEYTKATKACQDFYKNKPNEE